MNRFGEIWARAWRGFDFASTVQRLRAEDARRAQEALEAVTVEVEMMKVEPQPSITCPLCWKTSHHPKDIEEGYCGFCHWWTGREDMLADRLELWVFTYSRKREVPEGCTLHPAILDALVRVFQRGGVLPNDPLV